MFTKDGNWTFFRIYHCIWDLLEDADERSVYTALAHAAVRKHEKRFIEWGNTSIRLVEGQHFFNLREFSSAQKTSVTTLTRVLARLEGKGVIRIIRKVRGANGGTIVYLSRPEDLRNLRALRAARLKQLRDAITSEPNWEKDLEKKRRWYNLNQSLEQFKKTVKAQLERIYGHFEIRNGTNSGTLQFELPLEESLIEDDAERKPAGKGGGGAPHNVEADAGAETSEPGKVLIPNPSGPTLEQEPFDPAKVEKARARLAKYTGLAKTGRRSDKGLRHISDGLGEDDEKNR